MIEKLAFLFFVLRKWLPSTLRAQLAGRPKPVHVIFCMVDHFEPGNGKAPPAIQKARMHELLTKYPLLADGHRDASGTCPKRTWFFPPHDHRHSSLRQLVSLCESGYGEIELHLHHGKTVPDTSYHLARTIRLCIDEYSQFGIFGTENGLKRYGFIHGDWALANSLGGKFCGVNDEITVLRETGCYADFTFPCHNRATPSQINSIYYATGDPKKPKSYNRGIPARVGSSANGDLLIVQGPLHPIFLPGRFAALRAFNDVVSLSERPWKKRVDLWVTTGIHVIGKKDWVFIKVHTHGATDAEVVLGNAMDDAFSYLEEKYNDGQRYILHYATARELYNMIKAAEAGESGSPAEYRDYRIDPPKYDSVQNIESASSTLNEAVYKTYVD